jgi:hypothetical protein
MRPDRHGFLPGVTVTFYLLGCLLSCSLITLPLEAAEPSSRNLDSGWQFRAVANTDRSDVKQWHPAQVPGVVQTDLLHSGLIPDPFDRDNEFHLQWIGLADWEYETTFQVDAAALAHDHVDLVFEGLDTFVDVYSQFSTPTTCSGAGESRRKPRSSPGRTRFELFFTRQSRR